MTQRMILDKNTIENEFRQYKTLKLKADEMKIELSMLRDERKHNRDDLIETAVFMRPTMGNGGKNGRISDKTAAAAINLPIDAQIKAMQFELDAILRRVRRVESWLNALRFRERKIITMLYIDGMSWGELVYAYNQAPVDGIMREQQTFKRWRNSAIDMIYNQLKSW